jgi:hypothetical protein
VLLYADESEALTHPYLARAWARRGADLRVPAPGQWKKVAMMGAPDWLQRKLIVAPSAAPILLRSWLPSITSTVPNPARPPNPS